MTTKFIQEREVINVTAGANITTNQVCLNSNGDVLGVAMSTVSSGAKVALVTSGVLSLAKAAHAMAVGDRLYWDATNSVLSIYDVGPLVAWCVEAAVAGDASVKCAFDVAMSFANPAKAGKAVEFKKARFDATGGKAVGSHNLTGDFLLPINAKIVSGFFQVVTAPTSGGSATIAFGIPTDDVAGIKAATAIASYTTGAPIASIQTAPTAATEITTAARALQADVAVADLTAGVIDYYYQYYVVNE